MKTIKSAVCVETTFVYNHITKTIDGKEIDFKRAGIPGSDHEALLIKRMTAQPTYTLNAIKPKVNPNKETYAGLNNKLIKAYIPTQDKAAERMAEYEEFVANNSSFSTIKSWFLDTYKGFTVAKAKKVISNHKITTVKKAAVIKLSDIKKTNAFSKDENNEKAKASSF